MVTKEFCDRCDKEVGVQTIKKNFMQLNTKVYEHYRYITLFEGHRILCKDCMQDFNKFMEKQ